MQGEPKIPAYFSHSYRPGDRAVNLFFFNEMWRRGFTFTVDPKSSSLSTTHLEIMMRDNACFVGVVTRRDEERIYRCSPFSVYEFGLSLLEPKPRIMFLEQGVPAHHFLSDSRIHVFDRDRLNQFRFNEVAIDELREEAEAFVKGAPVIRPGEVGLAMPRSREYARVVPRVVDLLRDAGYDPVELRPEMEAYEAAAALDRLDFLLIDIVAEDVAPWLFAFSRGKATPTIKLVHRHAAQINMPRLPPLANVKALNSAASTGKVVLFWEDEDELLSELERRVARLHLPRRGFVNSEDGHRYFMSLGRAQGPVFISNAQRENALAREIERRLDLYNIEHFHYLYHNTIPLGTLWEARLLAKVRECRIFIPLLSENYWQSEWCRRELEVARKLHEDGRMVIMPYFLDDTRGDLSIPDQGQWIGEWPLEQQATTIVDAVDAHLARETALLARPRPRAADRLLAEPDLAIIVTSKAQYEAIVAFLDGPTPMVGTISRPNKWDWIAGGVEVPHRGRYRVLVALAKSDGAAVRDATKTAVEVFTPEYVVLCSDAVNIGSQLRLGSAFIPERVYGFTAQGGQHILIPRADWDFPVPPVPRRAMGGLTEEAPPTADDTGGSLICGDSGIPYPVAADEVLSVWPDAVAINFSLVSAVEVLDDLYERGRIAHYTVVCGIAEYDVPAPEAVASVAAMVQQLLNTAWLRPPRADAR